MIDERSLKFNVYEYLNYCLTYGNRRGVAVITDKQYIFYSQILKDDYRTHDNIIADIETTIHPNSNRKGWDAFRKNNVYVFAVGSSDFGISLPDNGELSLTQLNFIFEILEQVDKYNKELESNNGKLKINLTYPGDYFYDYLNSNIAEIKQKLKTMVTKEVTIEEEKIIGKTIDKEQIKSNLLFHIGLQDCTTIRDIIKCLNKCSVYYYDSYYSDIFLEFFPDYSKLINMLNILYHLDVTNEKVQNVTYENVYEIICNSIKNIFKNIKTYNQLRDIAYSIKHLIKFDEFKDMFVNFDVFLEFMIDLIPLSDEEKTKLNNLISNTSSYNELSNLIFKLGYKKKKRKLEEKESHLVTQKGYLEKIEIRNNIINSKDELNELIKKGNELRDLLFVTDIELGTKDYFIGREKESIEKNNNAIIESSSNLFRKIKDRKKIKIATNSVDICESRLKKLELEKDEMIKKRDKFKEEIELIEEKFKTITHLDFLPFDEVYMQFYYADDYYFDESKIRESIEKIEKEIESLKKQLDNIIQIGLIKVEDETFNISNENEVSSIAINR